MTFDQLQGAIVHLRGAAGDINRATDDPDARSKIEKTWVLHDKLKFTELVGTLSALSHHPL